MDLSEELKHVRLQCLRVRCGEIEDEAARVGVTMRELRSKLEEAVRRYIDRMTPLSTVAAARRELVEVEGTLAAAEIAREHLRAEVRDLAGEIDTRLRSRFGT